MAFMDSVTVNAAYSVLSGWFSGGCNGLLCSVGNQFDLHKR